MLAAAGILQARLRFPGEAGFRRSYAFLAFTALLGRRRFLLNVRRRVVRGLPRKKRCQRITFDGLLLKKDRDHRVQPFAVVGEQLFRCLVGFVDYLSYLFIDLLGNLLAVVALLRDLPTEEDKLFLAPEGAGDKPVAHTPLRDHLPSETRRVLEVVLRACRALAEDELLCHQAS